MQFLEEMIENENKRNSCEQEMYYRTAEQRTHEAAAAALDGLNGEGAQEEVARKERRRRNSLVFLCNKPIFAFTQKLLPSEREEEQQQEEPKKKHSREKRRSKLVGKEEEAEKAEEVEFGGREGRGPQKS